MWSALEVVTWAKFWFISNYHNPYFVWTTNWNL